MPDSAFILRAYEKWGEGSLHHLIGTFAFALWDLREQSLLIANSPLEERPLFFYSTPQCFAFSSMPKGLFALPFVPRQLNLTYMADYLTRFLDEEGSTFYKSIYRLTGGHFLTLRKSSPFKIKRYWEPNLKQELRLPRDNDYVEAYNELYERVVSNHLRSLTPVGVSMSGGLDSSSIAAMAAPILKCEGKRLFAFTEVPRQDFSGSIIKQRYADETPYVKAIAQMYDNIDLNLVQVNGEMSFENLTPYFRATEIPFPNSSNRVWIEKIYTQSANQGVRVLFSSKWGNCFSSWTGVGYLPQLLRKGHWIRALREASGMAQRKTFSSIIFTLASRGVIPTLPTPLWRSIMRLRHRNNVTFTAKKAWEANSPIHPEFAKIQQVEERAMEKGADLYYRSTANARQEEYGRILKIGMFGGNSMDSGYEALLGLQQRDPTGDLRIAEFCISLPEEQYQRNGVGRWLIRRAMANRLPQEVVTNQKRGQQAADYFERLYRSRPAILNLLDQLEKNSTVQSVLNLKRMRQLTEEMPKTSSNAQNDLQSYRFILENGLMTGRFLTWFESGE